MPSSLPLVHPHRVSVVEPGGTSVTPVSVRDRLSPTRKEKLLVYGLSTPLSRAGKDASSRKMALVAFFSLLQMGANNSSLTHLNCILKN